MGDKRCEELIFDIFRQRHGLTGEFIHYPGHEPGSQEKPDFIRDCSGESLGIEITEINISEKIYGKPLREHEATKHRIVDRACEKAIRSGLPVLRVSVIFEGNIPTGQEACLTEALFQTVKCHCPGPDQEVELNERSGAPKGFWKLFICNDGDLLKEHYWDYIEPGDVEMDFAPQIQEVIDAKSDKVPSYLKYCRTCWLVIAALGDRPSSYYELTDAMRAIQYQSGFDRVFFLNVAFRTVEELRTRKDKCGGEPETNSQ